MRHVAWLRVTPRRYRAGEATARENTLALKRNALEGTLAPSRGARQFADPDEELLIWDTSRGSG